MSEVPAPAASSTASSHTEVIGWRDPRSAVRDPRAHAFLWITAAVGLAADLWSKAWAFSALDPGTSRPWIPHVLEFQLSRNPGALFGMGSGLVVLFVVASVAALGFVMFMFASADRRQRAVHIALACILAGAMGNLYDRVFERFEMIEFRPTEQTPAWRVIGHVVGEPTEDTVSLASWTEPDKVRAFRKSDLAGPVRQVGVVRDFLKIVWKIGDTELWPWIFNVADVLLVIGVVLLLISFWRAPKDAAPLPAAEAVDSGA